MLRPMAALAGIRSLFGGGLDAEPGAVFAAGAVAPELPFEASPAVLSALGSVGRTEDLRFSPDNSLLAIAGHVRNVALLLRVSIELGPSGPSVTMDDFAYLTSKGFGGLHGVDWLDGETLVTGNRDGRVLVVRVPKNLDGRTHEVEVLSAMRAGKVRSNLVARPHSPGSLAVARLADGQPVLFVCNNYKNRVTEHRLAPTEHYLPERHRVAIRRGLKLPDGIAVSPDGRWVVVASHLTHEVLVWDRPAGLNWRTPAVARLRGATFPHGLRFGPNGRLFVTDAGSPYVFWFESAAPWSGVYQPAGRVRVMDNDTFERCRPNPREGGAKGVDLDSTGSVIAITCEQLPLRMFSMEQFVESAERVL